MHAKKRDFQTNGKREREINGLQIGDLSPRGVRQAREYQIWENEYHSES